MIVRIYQNTGGDQLGFSSVTRRYLIDFALGPKLRAMAGDASRHDALIDRESLFNGAAAQRVTDIEPEGEIGRLYVNGQPSDVLLTRVEMATLAWAMPTGR